ncbi:MAG: type II toxin-antitoxin system VapC family toxin [bacterium]
MILIDTGPMVALLDKSDAYHTQCINASKRLPAEPLLTTWPCFTEAMYLLGDVGGYRYVSELWRLQQAQRIILHDLTVSEMSRMAELMEKYQDTPMDMADASLVAVAESQSFRRIFTLDSDFFIYRLADGSALEIVR